MGLCNHECEGCYYYKGIYRGKFTIKCCHFLLIEDEKRGCPAGHGCTRRLEVDEETAKIMDRNYINQMSSRNYYG